MISRWAPLPIAGLLALAAGCTSTRTPDPVTPPTTPPVGSAAATADPYAGYASQVYHGADHWVCSPVLPGDRCRPLSGTVVGPDGSPRDDALAVAPNPPIDCFYVYPTTSAQPTINADLSIDGKIAGTVHAQAAPFSSVCRVFAPVYRQLTLHALDAGVANVNNATYTDQAAADIAYHDIQDAWRTYLAEENHGRGVVLVGDSQGTFMLKRLLAEEIEPRPVIHQRLVSAILLGGGVVAGSLKTAPCTADDESRCVIAYEPFPADAPPGPDSLFGRAPPAGGHLLCVNPAALGGGTGRAAVLGSPGSFGVHAGTPFATLPDALPVSCRSAGSYDYLAVGRAAPDDHRALDTWLDHNVDGVWGYHGIDVDLTLGTLLKVVAAQARAWH
ncbi:MAG: hypothetical protein AUI14_18810 [Actinobacteria bacterium 13_2_20CM_2_71_6]|nr:MAG: hypothetical protein AUI14_18810 [Actinobacteria bacterium 13_2_20CM_2_71_6]